LFNTYFNRGRKYDPTSTNSKNLDKFILELENKGIISIKTKNKKQGSSSPDEYVDYVRSEIPNFPWGVSVDHVNAAKAAYGPDNPLSKELCRAVITIK
jgi:hypothetical protein